DPPLVGVSIGKQASCYELLRRSASFGISVLGAAQAAVAQRFASGFPPLVHWEGIETRRGPAGVAPLLAEARGLLECAVRNELDGMVALSAGARRSAGGAADDQRRGRAVDAGGVPGASAADRRCGRGGAADRRSLAARARVVVEPAADRGRARGHGSRAAVP